LRIAAGPSTLLRTGLAALGLALDPASAASTESYPSKPVRMVVAQTPGGVTDITARIVSQRLAESLKQSVIVDNRPGAGTVSGTEIVARAVADGHTLLVVGSSFTINPSVYARVAYDPVRDFAPITQLSRSPYLLAAHPALPVTSTQELIATARSRPGQLNYASAGTGTGTHVSMELLRQMTGIDVMHIPYKGGGQSAIAAVAGQVELVMGTPQPLLPHVRAGKLRAIAVSARERASAIPEVPTFAESGVVGYEQEAWNGLFAPAKTPAAIVQRLNTEVARVLAAPEVAKIFAHDAATAVGASAETFAALVKRETAKWAQVIKAAGIKPQM
jgi:tripartite-type tricarboxylate transporter receptor subunit TctC